MLNVQKMEILARGVGRRKEAVAQVQIVKGTGLFTINKIPAQQYLHNNTCSLLSVKAPFQALNGSYVESPNLPLESPKRAEPLAQRPTTELVDLTKTEEINSMKGLDSVAPEGRGPLKNGPLGSEFSGGNNVAKNIDTIVKVKGGGLIGQAEAIKLGLARALCELNMAFPSSWESPKREEAPDTAGEKTGSFLGEPDSPKGSPLGKRNRPVPTGPAGSYGAGQTSFDKQEESTNTTLNTDEIRKQLKDKGYLTQDSRVKERRKYGLKKARKATQYNKR